MDNNDSNVKSQQTGGLKLMTVFIAVLALHVLVIGGFTVYHLMSGGSSDVDLTLDKTHKLKTDGASVTDVTTPDTTTPDKSATTTPVADTAVTPSTTPAPAPDAAAPAPESTTPAVVANSPAKSATVSAPTWTTPQPVTTPAPDKVATTPLAPIAPGLIPPPEPNLIPMTTVPAPTPTTTPAPEPVAAGPVHMPTVASKSAPSKEVASESALVHETKKETYTVKITDSYKKIAHAHHITVAQLKEANHIKGDTLHTGQKLIIPTAKTSLAKSESLDSAPATGETVSTESLSASPATSSTHHHTYTVAKGDTLKKIAKKFNTTTAAIKDANNLSDSKLTVGKKLKIPSKESRSAGTTVPSPTQPSQVQMQPSPVAQPAPIAQPAPTPAPVATPELANMTF